MHMNPYLYPGQQRVVLWGLQNRVIHVTGGERMKKLVGGPYLGGWEEC